MIKAILIDDEVHCIDTLNMLISDYCPEVQVCDSCMSGKKALDAIEKIKPDLIFLDIEMPVMNGFEVLENFIQIPFSVIFTTGYDQYAIKAIRFSALDYLLKPIDPIELIAAIHKVQLQKAHPSAIQFRMMMDQIQRKENNLTKIAVPTIEGFELVTIDQVIYCEADDNYTHVYLKNGYKLTACRTLKEIEEQLEEFNSFLRVHNSYLVNLNEAKKYIRGDGGYLIMNNGSTINVSRSRKELLLKKFNPGGE
ncbi:MAG TPA: LytTR family DNA-binding domain-containing protein [Puia sp.]|nr:LytTR family DNA-binding domain-containing protein [Puia sp.]